MFCDTSHLPAIQGLTHACQYIPSHGPGSGRQPHRRPRLNLLLRFLLLLLAGTVLLFVLLMSVLGLAFSMLRWLFTGRKPHIAVVFQTYRKWQQHAAQQMYPSRTAGDVIEAEVREVTPSPTTPPQIDDKR